jgi:hypothetical protein
MWVKVHAFLGGLLVETTLKRMFDTIALAAALTLAGCAGPPKDHPTLQQMKALSTAGFDLKMADTPAKLERIEKLPQRQLAQVEHKGRQVYVYTDAQGCQCLYAGDENAYRRLINQARQQKIDQRSWWAQDQSNRSTYYYKGEPINWGDVITITGSDVDLEDLRGGD